MNHKKRQENYKPDQDELEDESNHTIDVQEDVKNKAGKVAFPEVEEEYTTSSFKADIAQQAGRFSDQVLMDSPAAEARTIGKEALADIIASSEDKLEKKMKKK